MNICIYILIYYIYIHIHIYTIVAYNKYTFVRPYERELNMWKVGKLAEEIFVY